MNPAQFRSMYPEIPLVLAQMQKAHLWRNEVEFCRLASVLYRAKLPRHSMSVEMALAACQGWEENNGGSSK